MLMMTTMVGIAKISMLLLLVFLGKMATREILMQWVGVTSGMILMLQLLLVPQAHVHCYHCARSNRCCCC